MAIIDTTKSIVDLAKKGLHVELQEKIMQLREEALELQEENLRLKTENIALRKKAELQEKVTFKRKVYYREGDEVPCCPYCYDKDGLLIHLIFLYKDGNEERHHCQECRTTYITIGQKDFTYYSRAKK